MVIVATSLDTAITMVVATLVTVAKVLTVVVPLRVVITLAVVKIVVASRETKELAAGVASSDMPPTNGAGL